MKYYVYTIIAIVATSVVAGFFIVGSPKTARLFEQDNQRLSSLQMIQSEIINFWINKARLPKMLSELEDDIRGVRIPSDPETGAPYTYTVTGAESFKLCAVFAKPSLISTRSNISPKPIPAMYYAEPYAQDNWQHGEGEVCFDRTIDKEIYRPTPIKK
ncbi:MAG: hypothetical protein Q7S83_01705 [bacterium]|nr:hypothetical protein [bacterium]